LGIRVCDASDVMLSSVATTSQLRTPAAKLTDVVQE